MTVLLPITIMATDGYIEKFPKFSSSFFTYLDHDDQLWNHSSLLKVYIFSYLTSPVFL